MSTPSACNRSGNERFPKSLRLRRPVEFRRVYERRISAGDGTLVLFVLPNGIDNARLGLAVSRKIGNAVVRNRWKRLIREAFRRNRAQLPLGIDMIVLPARGAALPTLAMITASLLRLARRLAFKLNIPKPPTS